jgi:hypothetical protein
MPTRIDMEVFFNAVILENGNNDARYSHYENSRLLDNGRLKIKYTGIVTLYPFIFHA